MSLNPHPKIGFKQMSHTNKMHRSPTAQQQIYRKCPQPSWLLLRVGDPFCGFPCTKSLGIWGYIYMYTYTKHTVSEILLYTILSLSLYIYLYTQRVFKIFLIFWKLPSSLPGWRFAHRAFAIAGGSPILGPSRRCFCVGAQKTT